MDKKNEAVEYWLKSAKRDKQTAEILFENKRYDHCLFFCHLFIEKLLKGIYVKRKNESPPLTHKLERLAQKAGLKLETNKKEILSEITTFNIQARYDDYKFEFHKKATKKFTEKYLKISRSLYLWLLKQV